MPVQTPINGSLLQHLKDTNTFNPEMVDVIDYVERVIDLVDRTNNSLNPTVSFTFSTSGTINSPLDACNDTSTTY